MTRLHDSVTAGDESEIDPRELIVEYFLEVTVDAARLAGAAALAGALADVQILWRVGNLESAAGELRRLATIVRGVMAEQLPRIEGGS